MKVWFGKPKFATLKQIALALVHIFANYFLHLVLTYNVPSQTTRQNLGILKLLQILHVSLLHVF